MEKMTCPICRKDFDANEYVKGKKCMEKAIQKNIFIYDFFLIMQILLQMGLLH